METKSLELRSRPNMLTKTIGGMTREQKEVVRDMGFGGLLQLKLRSIPKEFARFVINQLDDLVLHTPNGDIPIDRMAVHEVLGFPLGHKKIECRNVSNYDSDLSQEWKEYSQNKLGLKDISDRIMNDTRANRMFQVDFLILMSSLMISAKKNNKCNREILITLPVNFVSQEYDWCEYVVRSVENCKKDWDESMFCGPLVFLMLLYCDRVSIALDPPVLRNRPVVAQWKHEDLQRRVQAESSGERFGLGLFLDEWKNTAEARDWRKQNVHFEECGCLSIEDDGHEMEDETGPSLQNTPSLEISHAAAATNLENSSLVQQFSELSVDAAGLSLLSPNAAGLSLSSPNVFEYANDGVADAYVCETQEDPVLCADKAVPIKDANVCETQEDPVLCADEAVPIKEKQAAVGEAKVAKPSKRLKRQSKQVDGPLRRSERPKTAPNRYSPSEVKPASRLPNSTSEAFVSVSHLVGDMEKLHIYKDGQTLLMEKAKLDVPNTFKINTNDQYVKTQTKYICHNKQVQKIIVNIVLVQNTIIKDCSNETP
ncbi:hypothetical protein CTI12_AA619720 [Artemisia annua]|uniref:Ulp1 protease family, C-terminal catalytic domain-containing protein n=1 Tax=Artemisia annua TaxID=35608 RepID=A0A2U1KC83_ARTAN|nr:hypothetical protein CTI12_AA619720 [Artemisia annua]